MNKGLKILMWTVLCILFVFVFTWITMSLWNWLVPDLFNGPHLTFWKAFGLLLLAKILFGGFGGRRWGGRHNGHWKHRYYQKWSSMTPEQRERFKSRMMEKWCPRSKSGSEPESDTSKV